MLKSVIISQRGIFSQRIERLQAAIARAHREGPRTANYRRTIALYRDLILVIDTHDGVTMEPAE